MPSSPPRETVRLSVAAAMADIDKSAWDAVANPGWSVGRRGAISSDGTAAEPFNPFVCHDFLSILEEAGTVSARTGWLPRHLLLDAPGGGLAGAVPAYLKNHSQGEFVFDHGWADAFERAGGRYYPKLQVSVPFTPATGPRLLAAPGPEREAVRSALAEGIVALERESGASSAHVTFPSETEWRLLTARGFLARTDRQFHWFNEGFGSFDDFLETFASRKRKQVKRERREAVAAGITIERLTGAALTERDWDAFFAFYMDTGDRKWGRPYLNRRFFSLLGERLAERVVLVMAKREGRPIAGALNIAGSDTLYGRYWGALEHHPFLHFEVCYHQAVEHAIEHGLARVEAGAQGEHKLARGYRAVPTYSAHHIAHRGLRDAVANYLEREREMVAAETEYLAEHAPFRKAADEEG
jgi:predicted N-acyltransferase